MRKVIYIVGLSHSGSTLLDLLLGAHPNIIGLGEVAYVMKGDVARVEHPADSVCTCGQPWQACPYWSRVIEVAAPDGPMSFEEKYEAAFRVFGEMHDEKTIAVDSSKRLSYLKHLVACPDVSVSVVHLIKDVRAYTISQINSRQRKNRRLTGLHAFHFFREWYRYNIDVQNYLVAADIPHVQIGYEQLCLQTEKSLRSICDLVGVAFDEQMLDSSQSTSHIVLGNRMREGFKERGIQLDQQWRDRTEWRLPSMLLRGAMKYNSARCG